MSRIREARRRAKGLATEAESPAAVTAPSEAAPAATAAGAAGPADVASVVAGDLRARVAGAFAPVPPSTGPDIERLRRRGLETLDGSLSHKIVTGPQMSSAPREQYRQLAATLYNAQKSTGIQVVMMTSALPGEGKTLTAANLALTFSEGYQHRVLLVDADLRRPAVCSLFGVDPGAGAGDGIANFGELNVTQVTPHLAVLTIAASSSTPMAELTSQRMDSAIAEGRRAFDWLIIDTPPLGLLADASLLVSVVDGVVVVVRAESTPLEIVRRTLDLIGKQKTLGVVLNGVKRTAKGDRSYDYYNERSG